MSKPCLVARFVEVKCTPEERKRRATAGTIAATKRLLLSRAYQAEGEHAERDERAVLLSEAVRGSLFAQRRCLDLYGRQWRKLADALLANVPDEREDET